MQISDYFASLERGIRDNPNVTAIEVLASEASDDYNGLLKARIQLWDSSYLEIYAVVSTELKHPIRIHRAYTYLREKHHVFRYDNAPHHPELITHPHHKHVGTDEQVAPSEQPSLNQVLAEVADTLAQ